MRFVDIMGNIKIPVSNEELIILEIVKTHDSPLPKNKLNIREQEVARMLVQKGVLDRILIDEKIHFVYNDLEDQWR